MPRTLYCVALDKALPRPLPAARDPPRWSTVHRGRRDALGRSARPSNGPEMRARGYDHAPRRLFPRVDPPRSVALLVVVPALLPAFASAVDGRTAEDDARPLLAPPAPAIALRPAKLAGLESYACATCHLEVAEEWAASAHGLAWVDEQYVAALAGKKRPELCHACHAPEPLLAGVLAGRPETRDERRELGVHCESCHVDAQGTVLGPRGTEVAAHASRVADALLVPGSNELCSSCHATNIGPVIGVAKDFAAAGMAARGLSCVGCHMAPLERAWASDAPVRTGRSHALQTPRDPAFLALAFGRTHALADGKSVLVLTNQAGHRVPGLVGRELTFRAELLDAAGAVLESRELVLDERAYLPVDGKRELSFTRAGAALRLRGLHRDPRADQPVTFVDETLSGP
jgi:hypothetical protein